MISDIWLRAAQRGDVNRIKIMKKGLCMLDVNCVTCLGQSGLMLAIAGKHKGVIKYLIKLNCDLNVCDSKGENALSLALRTENFILSEYLYNKGCRVSQNCCKEIRDMEIEFIKRINNWKTAKYVIYTYLKQKINLN